MWNFRDIFPYTNIHELNLDWIMRLIKEHGEKIESLEEHQSDITELEETVQENTEAIEENTRAIEDNTEKLIPAGGSTGQMLAKSTDSDFDTAWVNPPSTPRGVPENGTRGQLLTNQGNNAYGWADAPAASNGIPAGGTSGQVLTKNSGADYDAVWQTPATPAGGGNNTVYAMNMKHYSVDSTTNRTDVSGSTALQAFFTDPNHTTGFALLWATKIGNSGNSTDASPTQIIAVNTFPQYYDFYRYTGYALEHFGRLYMGSGVSGAYIEWFVSNPPSITSGNPTFICLQWISGNADFTEGTDLIIT